MQSKGTLLLSRSDVEALLTPRDCIEALENVFLLQGQGKIPIPGILGIKAPAGGVHIKAGLLPGDRNYLVAKLNANFPGNNADFGLPTIQGVIVVFDAGNGVPLAILDSIDITNKRTAAASAVAAKYLARKDSSIATICGCGQQGRAHLRTILLILPLTKIYAFDANERAAIDFRNQLLPELKIDIELVRDLAGAIQKSDVCITCTTAKESFVRKKDVRPGTFIAAVGADDEHKQEIDSALIASAKVVTDSLEQSCTIGEVHHAIVQSLMRKEDVYAELCEIVAGQKMGRIADDEIIVFDSTGVAIEDAVAAGFVYERARANHIGTDFHFAV
ncbi:MAG TPA: ornithine cyclodeaminase family protein [Candidatus Udaeobacter sp.]|jgi:ornithine cyclodeaminase/alanine dehydrogenase-like protein (mu-crystallin family)|nr:ornithine cyclodeaminase family protein [Candidatus Udaeobacter sp.]HEU0275768.1 ornithine cyclodeaminase family protein [Candidatus Udaeobacter sp.]